MTKLRKNIFIRFAIVAGVALYVFYNHSFMRTTRGDKLQRTVNPIPYTSYFATEQQKPTTFFTAPAFPEYTIWCHKNQKLCSMMPLQQIYADMQWLSSIQFVGGQMTVDWLDWLYILLDNITNLSPYSDYPYVFWQLLIPQAKVSLDNKKITKEVEASWANAWKLAKKWIMFTCDAGKIDKIVSLSLTWFLQTVYNTGLRESLENPCKNYENAYYAWFNAFYYSNDIENAASFYKISSFNTGVPTMAPLMAAIVYGRWGQHYKSAILWFERYNDIKDDAEYDEILAKDADKAIRKSVMELQLQLLTEASEIVAGTGNVEKFAENACETTYNCLVEKWAIKKAITNSYSNNCVEKKDATNIMCDILTIGFKNGWITRNSWMTYPFETQISFVRDTTYKSRWIRSK